MAEHPNVALMKRGYEAFSKGDMATLTELFADDIVWHNTAGVGPLSGDLKGRDNVFGFFGQLTQLTEGSLKLDVHDILANDEHAVALITQNASRKGQTLKQNGVHVFHIKDGRVIEFWGHTEDSAASDAFFNA